MTSQSAPHVVPALGFVRRHVGYWQAKPSSGRMSKSRFRCSCATNAGGAGALRTRPALLAFPRHRTRFWFSWGWGSCGVLAVTAAGQPGLSKQRPKPGTRPGAGGGSTLRWGETAGSGAVRRLGLALSDAKERKIMGKCFRDGVSVALSVLNSLCGAGWLAPPPPSRKDSF